MAARKILLVKLAQAEGDDDLANTMANAVPLGRLAEVVSLLAQFNTAPDGDAETHGVLFGPGLTVQMPMLGPDDPVQQVMVSLDEEETAWPVLSRICRVLGWKMMDPSSGRTFGG